MPLNFWILLPSGLGSWKSGVSLSSSQTSAVFFRKTVSFSNPRTPCIPKGNLFMKGASNQSSNISIHHMGSWHWRIFNGEIFGGRVEGLPLPIQIHHVARKIGCECGWPLLSVKRLCESHISRKTGSGDGWRTTSLSLKCLKNFRLKAS